MLAHAQIDEEHLNDDHEIGEVEDHDIDDRGDGIEESRLAISFLRFSSASGIADWPRMDCATSPGSRLVPTDRHRYGEQQEDAQRDALGDGFTTGEDMGARLYQAWSQHLDNA